MNGAHRPVVVAPGADMDMVDALLFAFDRALATARPQIACALLVPLAIALDTPATRAFVVAAVGMERLGQLARACEQPDVDALFALLGIPLQVLSVPSWDRRG